MRKSWFITGASKGFGREWTEAALERGDRVAATARNPATLDPPVQRYGDAVLPIRLRAQLETNFFGALWVTQAAPDLLRQGADRDRDDGLRVATGALERVATRIRRGL